LGCKAEAATSYYFPYYFCWHPKQTYFKNNSLPLQFIIPIVVEAGIRNDVQCSLTGRAQHPLSKLAQIMEASMKPFATRRS
jgi:hypothetical protein